MNDHLRLIRNESDLPDETATPQEPEGSFYNPSPAVLDGYREIVRAALFVGVVAGAYVLTKAGCSASAKQENAAGKARVEQRIAEEPEGRPRFF